MRRRNSVFFSRAEARVKAQLKQRWEPRFTVYPNLPLTALLDFPLTEMGPRERAFVLKTSVDFTLVDTVTERHLLSVEFDGFGDGGEVRGVYRTGPRAGGDSESQQRREWALNFKLRAATAARYPLVIVTSSDVRPIVAGDDLTLFDVVVGEALVRQRADELRTRGIDDHLAENETMTADDFETIDLGAHIDAEFELDIVERQIEALSAKALKLGVKLPYPLQFGMDVRYGDLHLALVEDPPASAKERAAIAADGASLWGPGMLQRIERVQKLERWGARATFMEAPGLIHAGNGTIWVRNSDVISAPTVAQKIAALLLYRGVVQSLKDRERLRRD